MMEEMKPPAYDAGPAIGICPTGPQVNTGYVPDEGVVMPPTAPPFEMPAQQRMPFADLDDELTDEELREACYQFVSENCCYGKRFIRDTQLPEINNGCTFHYQLETFGEKRESVERHEPFTGQYVDGPQNGPPPGPWDIPITIPEMFQDCQIKTEIPHTAYVKECGRCVGNCRVRCDSCYGRGGREPMYPYEEDHQHEGRNIN
ncbi:protein SSUH2 [Caerostris extrusa]|uniref:Protein SSUH2 n=1 Tax=Caerostris extrusa TaxID=172846 RepID=A0AAV4M3V0_CAEEX|nr:protein SSUH2 [Caerostris extrusa]